MSIPRRSAPLISSASRVRSGFPPARPRPGVLLLALLLLALSALGGCVARTADTAPASSPDAASPSAPKQEQLVLRATEVVRALRAEPRYPGFAEALDLAEGVLIIPHYVRLGWMFGLGGGSGVLLARDAFGDWSSPAFYEMGAGGYGFQVGVESGALVYLFLDREHMLAGLTSGFNFGADADVVALTTVDRTEVSRLSAQRPVLLFSDMSGLYAGVTFSGGFVRFDDAANAAYYGTRGLNAEGIVLRREPWREDSLPLREALGVPENRHEAVRPVASAGAAVSPAP